MGDVIEFKRHEPHVHGMVMCQTCYHKWVAVVASPAPTYLECPQCRCQTRHLLEDQHV